MCIRDRCTPCRVGTKRLLEILNKITSGKGTLEDIDKLEELCYYIKAVSYTHLGCYCGDLLSWVMGRAKADDAWLTVMGNVNAIAVASLADTAGIILVEDAVLDADAKARAEQQEIAVYGTSLPAFEIALKIASLLG